MSSYRLTGAAEQDLIAIAQYGDEVFGALQSDRYRDQLKARFASIATYPLQYPTVNHIQSGYRRSVCGKHAIYYRIHPTEVVIIRILRGQDLQTALS